MTPEQLKQNPITVHPNQKPDRDCWECNTNKDGEETTTYSEMSEQGSESDTIADDSEGPKSTEDEEESEAIEIQQVHNDLNKQHIMKRIHLIKVL